jgi:hypothetical protein
VIVVCGASEQLLDPSGIEPHTVVGDGHLAMIIEPGGADVHVSTAGGVSERVVNEGGQRAPQRGRMAIDQQAPGRLTHVGEPHPARVGVVGRAGFIDAQLL